MAKYDGLVRLLEARARGPVQLSFDEVAGSVGGGLPGSAYRHRAWWANEIGGQHVQARAWTAGGWQVETVDLLTQRVTFTPVGHQHP